MSSDQKRFVLRMNGELHSRLKSDAAVSHISVNDLILSKLQGPSLSIQIDSSISDAIAWAKRVTLDSVESVFVFGSFARSEMRDGSDFDLLFVCKNALDIKRSLYKQWLQKEFKYKGYPISGQFVKLPELGGHISSLWAELALEGIALMDQSLRASRYLNYVRSEMASGHLIRKIHHGQPYWVHDKEVA